MNMLLLLLLSHFSRVRLCVSPYMAAHQAPPSLGFSRQEHWSGLPFPSPMHESEKWKWSCSVMSDSWRPYGLQPTRLLRPWDFPGKSTGVGCHCLLQLNITGISYCHVNNYNPPKSWHWHLKSSFQGLANSFSANKAKPEAVFSFWNSSWCWPGLSLLHL